MGTRRDDISSKQRAQISIEVLASNREWGKVVELVESYDVSRKTIYEIAATEPAIALDSTYVDAYNHLSYLYLALGRHADAAKAMEKAAFWASKTQVRFFSKQRGILIFMTRKISYQWWVSIAVTLGLLAIFWLVQGTLAQGPGGEIQTQDTTPSAINYQGHLTNPAGNPLSGSHTMRFLVYDAAPWAERRSGTAVMWQLMCQTACLT